MDWIAQHSYPADTLGNDPYGQRPPDSGPQPSKKMAGWSLGLSLAFCVPLGVFVAIGLAITVLVRGRDGRDHGRGMAIAALVVSSFRVVIAGVLIVVVGVDMWLNGWDETERDADGRVRTSGLVSIDRLQEGDCIQQFVPDDPTPAETRSEAVEVTVVPCADAHDAEVFGVNPLDPDSYVDQASLDAAAERGCLPSFEAYVGVPYQASQYLFVYYSPAVDGRSSSGDNVVCIAIAEDGRPVGQIEASSR